MHKKSLVLLAAFFLTGFAASAQNQSTSAQATAPAAQTAAPAARKNPDQASRQSNPVKPTADSIANGKRMYGYDCAMCHGATGDGKGDLASDMKLQLADLRDSKSLQGKTDRDLFDLIKNGKGDMPAEGTRAKPEQIWDMVNYLRSLAEPAKPAKTEATAKTD